MMHSGYLRIIPRFFKLIFIVQLSQLSWFFPQFQAKAATITVPAGGSLQSAINAAQPGDTISPRSRCHLLRRLCAAQ